MGQATLGFMVQEVLRIASSKLLGWISMGLDWEFFLASSRCFHPSCSGLPQGSPFPEHCQVPWNQLDTGVSHFVLFNIDTPANRLAPGAQVTCNLI